MAFTKDQLLLPAAKAAQLTAALATTGVADPLQQLCDEAAADVSRMTTGFVIDPLSLNTFIRSLALYRVYNQAGTGVPGDVKQNHDDALKELEAIAKGERPNLAKVADPAVTPIAGSWGSNAPVPGRMQP